MDLPPRETIPLPTGPTPVEWRRNRRARRVSLRVDPAGGVVVVTLPMRASRAMGLALLKTHADWVADRMAALPRAVPFMDGALIPIHGLPHRIRHAPGGRGGAWIEDGELHVTGEPAFLPRRVGDFLRSEARKRLSGLVVDKTAKTNLRASRVTIKDTTSRWGSCAPGGALAFSWRLVMAPAYVQDYVVAHEVAHLRHMNHGPAFWSLVDELTQHRDTGLRWLRRDGWALLRIGSAQAGEPG